MQQLTARELDLAGQRNYEAFMAALPHESRPRVIPTWNEVHAVVRQAWIAGAKAASAELHLNHVPQP